MSFWGATVITSFFSIIPVIGKEVVMWIWGGFTVGNPTLNRFYSSHYVSLVSGAVRVLLKLICISYNIHVELALAACRSFRIVL